MQLVDGGPSPLRSLEPMPLVEASGAGAAGLEVQVLALCRDRARQGHFQSSVARAGRHGWVCSGSLPVGGCPSGVATDGSASPCPPCPPANACSANPAHQPHLHPPCAPGARAGCAPARSPACQAGWP